MMVRCRANGGGSWVRSEAWLQNGVLVRRMPGTGVAGGPGHGDESSGGDRALAPGPPPTGGAPPAVLARYRPSSNSIVKADRRIGGTPPRRGRCGQLAWKHVPTDERDPHRPDSTPDDRRCPQRRGGPGDETQGSLRRVGSLTQAMAKNLVAWNPQDEPVSDRPVRSERPGARASVPTAPRSTVSSARRP